MAVSPPSPSQHTPTYRVDLAAAAAQAGLDAALQFGNNDQEVLRLEREKE